MPKQSYIVTLHSSEPLKDTVAMAEIRKALTGHRIWAGKECARKATVITKATVRPVPNDE